MADTIENTADILDVRDIIARYEELEALAPETAHDVMPGTSEEVEENARELDELANLLDALNGMGGDEQWRGDWYPVTLIRDSYFEDAMDEMIADCYNLDALNIPSFVTLTFDYDALKVDYSSVEIGGVTYWTR